MADPASIFAIVKGAGGLALRTASPSEKPQGSHINIPSSEAHDRVHGARS